MHPLVAAKWRRYQYRKIHQGMTVEEYELEPREAVDWDLRFAGLEAELQSEAQERERRKHGG